MSPGLGTTLGELRLRDRTVATYCDGRALDPTLSPRPFLHPVRTLRGRMVTDACPDDHRWHLGVSVTLADVDGVNLWGGRTYVRDQGYTWRDDHGRISHEGWERQTEDLLAEVLVWRRPDGSPVLHENRRLAARVVPGYDAWALDVDFTLENRGDREVLLGSPATNGRTGAGYGGLFWRLPRSAGLAAVFTSAAQGEPAVHGITAPWVAFTGDDGSPERPVTVALTARDRRTAQDPWFVRLDGYPGLCSSLAAEVPLVVPPGGSVTRRLTGLVADGRLTADDVEAVRRAAVAPSADYSEPLRGEDPR